MRRRHTVANTHRPRLPHSQLSIYTIIVFILLCFWALLLLVSVFANYLKEKQFKRQTVCYAVKQQKSTLVLYRKKTDDGVTIKHLHMGFEQQTNV